MMNQESIDFATVTACGECCDKCPKKIDGLCNGCIAEDGYVKEWAKSGRCVVHACARSHQAQFCGICKEFPCKEITSKIHWNPNIVEQQSNLAKLYHENTTSSKIPTER